MDRESSPIWTSDGGVPYVNETYARSGTLWQGRFKSAALSRDDYLVFWGRYIELNPVQATLGGITDMIANGNQSRSGAKR
jgi:hypothetical protein